ncbi:Spermatogenesis-associated protein 1 [Eurypyga helias]|nr:Spermatogenesis-associated protein 1 [Eurypyga helias]
MSFGQMRPQTSQLVELHVFYVPEEVWNFKLNTIPVSLTSKFISAGFIRVSPHITLSVLREKLGEYLHGVEVADKFKFLKCIGKKLAVVKAKQEAELELESFAPPYALYPELYLLPGVEDFEDVSSSTQQKHLFSAEANRFGYGSRLLNQNGSLFTPGHSNPTGWEKNRHSQDQEDRNTPEWNDKAKGTAPTLPVNRSGEQGQQKPTSTENNDHQKDANLSRDRTQDTGILKTMEDQTTEYLRKKQRCLLNIITISLENRMVDQLQQMKTDRRHMEKTREELIKKAKGLLEQAKSRRYHVREDWKKKYFETKKATVSLEDTLNKLRQDLELYHQKLLLRLEARDSRKQSNNRTNSKNYTIIRITTVQHELDQLRRKLDDTKMKLITEIKMRKQAASNVQALRAELTQKKIHSALILQSRKSGI